MLLAKKSQRLKTVHAGQLVIEQYQIEIRMHSREFKGARALARFEYLNLLSQTLENLTQALAHQRVIVDHKNFQHLE